ncbi:PREDICTED: fatty acid desaturase 4, chloroplastic-like isoform X2 [Brassica oleracea var. oleracea]|uniref:fatty acid desaturase 4, chloroplastic-like isoform X2 n=1 Tax=Brassica oleracea var. oleracea TaxID=109376 RepID=UPI0006A6C7AF|nr:PREDICTED: fatty acid desaturase 4, chloroplastic-like isoform X2 [Brassica oleracea var. oleracea]XP_013615392.1 PREDICTED: fatty acid desaturase 4, chloroplastic-like isoform X2 [Brassica oleracea var. oleracea]
MKNHFPLTIFLCYYLFVSLLFGSNLSSQYFPLSLFKLWKTYTNLISSPTMAVLLQTKYTLSPITNNIPRSHRPSLLRARVTCSLTPAKKSHPNREKLVLEKRLVNPPPSNDPTLQSTLTHRLWVGAGCTTVFASFAKSIIGGFGSHILLEPALAGYAGYILADLGSGLYHWAIDNYGDESTPLVGTQIEAARGHHKWPWIITIRQFANNSHALARGITFTVLPLVLACNDPVVHGFDMGLLLSRRQHVNHHRHHRTYMSYCIVSGVWNNVLDDNKIFEALEKVLYVQFGVKPRSWSHPNSE